jgi:hypothetical protein
VSRFPPASGFTTLLDQDLAVAGGASFPASANCALLIGHNLLTSPEGIGDGEHEEFGERDTLNQKKRAVSAEYP